MDPSASIEIIQNTSSWDIFAQVFSAVSIMFASIAAVVISGSQERKIRRKKKEYFHALVMHIRSRISVAVARLQEIEKNSESNSSLMHVLESLLEVDNIIEIIRVNRLEFTLYSPKYALSALELFLKSYEDSKKIITSYIEKQISEFPEVFLLHLQSLLGLIDLVNKVFSLKVVTEKRFIKLLELVIPDKDLIDEAIANIRSEY